MNPHNTTQTRVRLIICAPPKALQNLKGWRRTITPGASKWNSRGRTPGFPASTAETIYYIGEASTTCADGSIDRHTYFLARTSEQSVGTIAERAVTFTRGAYLRSMPFTLSTGVAFDPVTQATSALAACLSETAVLAAAENLISDWNSPGSGPRMSTPMIGRISLK